MSQQDLAVANEILQQLGGAGRLRVMIGAHSFMGAPKSLTVKFRCRNPRRINTIMVALDPSDTYNVSFWCITSKTMRMVGGTDRDVYADNLRQVIESRTGLYLSL